MAHLQAREFCQPKNSMDRLSASAALAPIPSCGKIRLFRLVERALVQISDLARSHPGRPRSYHISIRAPTVLRLPSRATGDAIIIIKPIYYLYRTPLLILCFPLFGTLANWNFLTHAQANPEPRASLWAQHTTPSFPQSSEPLPCCYVLFIGP